MNTQEETCIDRLLKISLVVLTVALCLATLLMASVPPVSRDALVHHLALPKLYLQHGRIYQIPELDFSYYPMNVDLLYLIALRIGNDIIPKYIHYFFALATGTLIYRYIKARLTHWYALGGLLLFLSTPVILKLSVTAYVDLGLVFFTTTSILLCIHWVTHQQKQTYASLFWAGCLAGLAAGTKYNGMLSIFILACLLPFFTNRSKASLLHIYQLYPTLIFSIGAIITFAPWLIRNFLWTGDPVFPLFQSFFHTTVPLDSIGHISPLLERKLVFHESFFQTALLPLRIFFQGQDNNPQYFDGRLNPFLLFLPFAAFWGRYNTPIRRLENIFLAGFAILFVFIALGQGGARVRYLTPALPSLVILSIFGLHNLTAYLSKNRSAVFQEVPSVVLLGIALVMNGFYCQTLWQEVDPIPFLRGTVSRDTYITERRPEYPVIQFANTHLSQDDKIYCLFLGNRGYYFDIPHQFDIQRGRSQMIQLINAAASSHDLLANLQMQGITHLLIWHELWDPEISRLTQEKQQLFTSFRENNVIELFHYQRYALYKIHP